MKIDNLRIEAGVVKATVDPQNGKPVCELSLPSGLLEKSKFDGSFEDAFRLVYENTGYHEDIYRLYDAFGVTVGPY